MRNLFFYTIFSLALLSLTACGQEDSGKDKNAGDINVIAFDTTIMDRSVSPCEDFDRFVNGKWKDTAKLPKGYSSWGSFLVLREENEKKVESIIQGLLIKDNPQGSEAQQLADMYRSFMDTTALEQLGVHALDIQRKQIDSIANYDDYLKVAAALAPYGVQVLWGWGVDADARASDKNAVMLGQSGLSIGDRDYYLKTTPEAKKIQNAFVAYVQNLLAQFGYDEKTAREKSAHIFDLETQLAKIQLSKVARRDPVKTYNKMPVARFANLYPDLQLQNALPLQGVKTDSIIVESPAFLHALNAQLKKLPIATLKDYLEWDLINSYARLLTHRTDSIQHAFYGGVLQGISTQKPRDKRAIDLLNRTLGELVGKKYVEKFFSERSKRKVSDMIENVRAVYKNRIENSTWMSEKTKKAAIEKLLAFKYKIGYPDKWKDYSSLHIDKKTLLANVMATRALRYQRDLEKIGKPVDKSEWFMNANTVNAYYTPTYNEVVFPAGILQPPFYNANADDAINYGGIIAVIGHEFTHGFDDQGSQFSGTGELHDWWTKEDKEKFKARAERFGKLYTNYKGLPSKGTINAAFTMGENIADLGGLVLAYYALQKSLEGKPAPEKVDGFTAEQRFFLSWARVWKSISTIAREKQQLETDPHSPARARINVPLSDLPEFAAAWKCNIPSSMQVPKSDQVVIW